MHRHLFLAAPIAVVLCLTSGQGRAAAPPDRAAQVRTVSYPVRDLLHKPGEKTGFGKVEEVVAALIRATGPDTWREGAKGAATLEIVNDTHLEVRATGRQHAEIADLLLAFGRLLDVAVEVRSELREVDRAFYDKQIKPRLRGRPAPGAALFAVQVDAGLVVALRKRSTLVKSNKVRLADGRPGTFFSLRRAFTYRDAPPDFVPLLRTRGGEASTPQLPGGFQIGYTGVTFRAQATVSRDRRFVTMKIAQKTAELGDVEKSLVPTEGAPGVAWFEAPRPVESATSTSLHVADGGLLLVPVHARLAGARKDKVWVLVMQPLVYIEEEERERARLEGAK